MHAGGVRTLRLTRSQTCHIVTSPKTFMDFLLAFNNEAALVGDLSGNVRTERRPSQLTPQAWENRLRFAYIEAERGGEDAGGISFINATGSFRFENGQVKVMKVEGVKPYQTFSDTASGLSVRAVFLEHLNQWTVAE
jgi:hypothetical protein